MTTPLELGKIGIWTWTLDGQPMAKSCEAVQELEELGFKTVWIPEAVGREPFAHAGILLSATKNSFWEPALLPCMRALHQPCRLVKKR